MSTDPARWARVSALFDRAVDLDAAARTRLLDAECADARDVRDEVERMLAADAATAHRALDAGAAALVGAGVGTCDDGPGVGTCDDGAGVGAGDDGDADASVGSLVGPWRLERLLGRGGMGVVHAARRADDSGQRAAVKRLLRRWDGSAQAWRFLQERRILATLSHPHLPRLLDHGVDADGRPWFALELIEGRPLHEHADAQRLGLRARIALLRDVCAAVQHAHEHFVVHRDLKPANILVDADGHPKVLDFGVAKRTDVADAGTRTGAFAGFTPEYAAPEQVTGGPVTAATDVHALGVLLYQLLSGRLPYRFDAADLRATTAAIATATAGRLDEALTTGAPDEVAARMRQRGIDARAYRRFVRGDLSRIVQTALAKEPARRYSSVQAFSTDLGRFLDGRTVSVTGDHAGYRARTFVRRNPAAVAMALVALLAVAGGIGGVLLQAREARASATRAVAEAQRAEREAARARSDAETLAATNEFLRGVFEGANPDNTGRAAISLEEALDSAVARIEDGADIGAQARVRFLLAAASSYDGLGQAGKSETAVRRALAIQEAELADSVEDRARVLSALAWARLTYEPAQALALAEEAMALERRLVPPSTIGMRIAWSVLGNAQYFNGQPEAALATTRATRQFLLDAGDDPEGIDVTTTWQSEAFMLADLARWEEAYAAHETAIRLRGRDVGDDSFATARERVYYGFTLNNGGLHADALRQFDQALPAVRAEAADGAPTMQLLLGRGVALVGLRRFAEAVADLAPVHDYGRAHPFDARQARVAYFLARAQAGAGDCAAAAATLSEMDARALPLPDDRPLPLAGSRCAGDG